MWACLAKTCPCLPLRGESKSQLYFSYANDDNLEFENLLAQDHEAILTRAPFAGYRASNMVVPNEEATASSGNFLDDEDNLQTQDAQFLPDEQIEQISSKFTELINEQAKNNQVIDEQLAAEEEEARRIEEEDYERKRLRATEAAISKGLITPDQAAINNDIFTIEDDDVTDSSKTVCSVNLDGGSSVELFTTTSQRNASNNEEEQNTSSLNRPRNPHERFVVSEINADHYADLDESPPTNSKDQPTIDDPLSRC